jgi:hypothetical protein
MRRGGHTKRRHRSSHFLVVHFDETGLLDPIPNFLSESAYRLQTNWLRNYGEKPKTAPKLDRQANPWAPAALFTSESRSLNDLLSNSLDKRYPAKKLMQVFRTNSDRESKRLASQRRQEALRIANRIDDAEPESLKIEMVLGEMTSAEKRVFRKERRRRRRLLKEEQIRMNRRMELEKMRNRAAKNVV